MKLPDFTNDVDLNALRQAMGASLREYTPPISTSAPLTEAEIEILSKSGMDIPLEDVVVLPDGTLAYKNQRVVLYIRDVRQYRKRPVDESLPRFHVANCDKLKEMRANKRFERYVVATRDTGVFQINLVGDAGSHEKRDYALNVCQYCLAAINWDNFIQKRKYDDRRKAIVAAFSLKGFFDRFGKTYVIDSPKHTDETAPINDYGPNFQLIANMIKAKRNYRCDNCGADFSKYKRFLHAHHVNGLKHDNSEGNIELLCVAQHAKQPYHGHMKSLSEYSEFLHLAPHAFKTCKAN